MKIENRGLISIDVAKLPDKKNVEKASKTQEESGVLVDAKLSQTLRDTVDAIARSGMSPGDVHSDVQDSALGLLHSMEVEAKRPRLSDEDLLGLADRVSAQMKAAPKAALAAFSKPDSDRVSDLVH